MQLYFPLKYLTRAARKRCMSCSVMSFKKNRIYLIIILRTMDFYSVAFQLFALTEVQPRCQNMVYGLSGFAVSRPCNGVQ